MGSLAGAERFWAGSGAGLPGIDGIWRHAPSTDERELALGIAERHFVPPDGCSDLILRFGRGRLVGVFVQEPTLLAETVHIAPEDALFGVRFAIGTGGALLQQRELVELEAQRLFARADSHDVARVTERLLTFTSEAVQRYALGQPAWLRAVLEMARERSGNVSVEELARWAGISERTLHRGFADWVGAGPKQLLRTLRICEAVRLVSLAPSLAELAADLGFADQAHLTREMRYLWGTPPGRLRGVSDSFKTPPGERA